ncbi:hypothetical protein R0381_001632 [Jeongeupia wiesaeckerbachi]|uniref:hypothetical protein n=1 Tax=Jeongeupia wiesaeckerbachi TaxID=3051218 RepID=UPI003D80040E
MKSLPQCLRTSLLQSLQTVGVLALVLQAMAGMSSQMNYLIFFAVYFPLSALVAGFRASSSRPSNTHSSSSSC